MQAPIPEIPPEQQKGGNAKTPFVGLSVMCSIEIVSMILSTLFFIVLLKPNPDPQVSRATMQMVNAFMLALMAVNLIFLWRGFNLARWIYWAFTVVGILGIPATLQQNYSIFPDAERAHLWIGTLFSLGFSIWLALPSVARHFTRKDVK